VKAYEFIKWLVHRAGGPLPVAKAMRAPGFQPTLHKICAGHVASPKRSSAERIAAHFAIPVDAVYDDALARRLYESMRSHATAQSANASAETAAPVARPAGTHMPQRATREVLEALARLLAEVPTSPRRSAIAALLASFAHEAGAPEYVDILAVALQPAAPAGNEPYGPRAPAGGADDRGRF
jgi:hypothetical protein